LKGQGVVEGAKTRVGDVSKGQDGKQNIVEIMNGLEDNSAVCRVTIRNGKVVVVATKGENQVLFCGCSKEDSASDHGDTFNEFKHTGC
jgi:hypothetical protein